jgi:hypothetical protein
MAFPPYRKDRLDPDFCYVDQFQASEQVPRDNGDETAILRLKLLYSNYFLFYSRVL